MDDLRSKAKKKMPKFAFEYLDGGCNEDVNLQRNTSEIRELSLVPKYLAPYKSSSLKTELFGHEYDAPFGIAPVGFHKNLIVLEQYCLKFRPANLTLFL